MASLSLREVGNKYNKSILYYLNREMSHILKIINPDNFISNNMYLFLNLYFNVQ